ncbi:MAG: WD40 repeat domain-containing protein [Undibacterium sp.]|nr:WD40 repeat domain-containing protein [Undibacterium sp.]
MTFPKNKDSKKYRYLLASTVAICAGAVVVACGGGGSSSSNSNSNPNSDPNAGTGTPQNPVEPVKRTPSPAPWPSYGGTAQHDALATVATQGFGRIVWKAPVDLAPQYSPNGYLLVHYGSPVITLKNTVILPVKTAAQLTYRIEARSGTSGQVIWSENSDYIMPAHRWTPTYNATLTANNRMLAPGAGGKVIYRDDADESVGTLKSMVFYGDSVYAANKAALDKAVIINTPITADAQNNIYFGFIAEPGNPAGLTSGFARIGADGKGTWVGAAAASGVSSIVKPATNSAPAISLDQKTLYVLVNNTNASDVKTLSRGYLLALDSSTLALKSKVLLVDPNEKGSAYISDDSTAAPLVAPDGDVYMGVLEQNPGSHNSRGWLLHFNADLSITKTPGSFGWDDTPSIVPADIVSGYTGTSKYLLMTKYNNYQRTGSGDGLNKIAIIDPNVATADAITPSVNTMKEILTIIGPTPDPNAPGGFIEWCVNTAAVDPFTKSVIVNSEDGYLYRWSLTSNKLTEKIKLTSGMGESYTPTAVGPDGKVYAINNAVLFSIGQ